MGRGVPTGSQIPEAKKRAFYKALAEHPSVSRAARMAGISRGPAAALAQVAKAEGLRRARSAGEASKAGRGLAEAAGLSAGKITSVATRASGRAGNGNPWANGYASLLGDLALPDPFRRGELSPEALRALDDFGYFRRRYLGRGRSPWQERAGEAILEWLLSPITEFVVMNAPPAAGKSTLCTHDVVVWLICRDRRIRIMLGSRTYNQAVKYSRRVRRTLTSRIPYTPTDRARRVDGATDAQAVLCEDYGRFRPDVRGEAFQAGGFTVAQLPGEEVADKEPTVAAFGFDADYMGMRPDVSIWDDLVDLKNIRTQDQRDDIRELWDNVAEPRIEPGGLLLLQGQRLRHDDLYRYNLDKRAVHVDEDDPTQTEELGPKYRHVTFPAHQESECQGNHGLAAPALFDPGGCLLDPRRLDWGKVRTLEVEQPDVYRVVYQQEDLDPGSQVVRRIFVDGGLDADGTLYPGCWDHQRSLWQLPPAAEIPGTSYICGVIDPSVSNWWAIQVWLYHPQSQRDYLLAVERRRMEAPDLLERHPDGTFTGLLPEYHARLDDMGVKLRHWIVEVNVHQKWLIQYRHARDWAAQVGVNFVAHTTGIYKTDASRGIPSVAPQWRTGRIRLPGNPFDGSRGASDLLVNEMVRWPHTATEDQVMAHWFHQWNKGRLFPRTDKPKHTQWRPSWLKAS